MFYWRNKLRLQRKMIYAVVAASASACIQPKKDAGFYPVDSLVTAQIQNLAVEQARLQKHAVLKDQIDSLAYVPKDTAAWAKELDIFRQLETINKPINRKNYRVIDGLPDSSSNLTVKSFTSTEDLPVRYLKIYYQKSLNNPRKIEAWYEEKNSLYKSGRLLALEFAEVNNKTVLTSYSIEGGQKMIMADSVAFSIKGTILVD